MGENRVKLPRTRLENRFQGNQSRHLPLAILSWITSTEKTSHRNHFRRVLGVSHHEFQSSFVAEAVCTGVAQTYAPDCHCVTVP